MASKPINPQPLQMPNLSQLPDPMKDLMGGTGLTNPTSMMTMNQQGINDLFAPKPIDGNFIKPSAEAAKALQTAQQQAQAQTDEVAKLQQQQLEIIEEQKREAERQAQENMKLAEQMRKEREKALKEKKEQQGGKLGAAPDGSFVLVQDAKALIAHSGWKAITSDMQRNDQMNNWLKENGDTLRKQGIAEDVIKAELEQARKIISDDTRQYVKGMREDGTDLHDLGLSVVKGLAPISNLIGAGVGALGFDNAASTLHQFGTDLSNAMDEAKSKTMQLDKANNDYLNQKSAELNPNRGWFERAGDSLANIHKSGNKFSTAVDLVGVAIPALLTGGGTALASQGAGRATIAYAGRFAQGGLANKGLTFAGNQIAKHGASVTTVAAFGGGDAAQSAWDGVMNTSFDNIKTSYIRAYGETDWNALVKEHNGDEEAIKRDIANNSAEKAVSAFVPMAILAAPLGLESMVARTVAGKANAVAGSKLLAIGAAGISEGIEEGLTTFSGNLGQHARNKDTGELVSLTGTTLDAGVPEAAAIGMVAGVGMSAPMTMYDAAQAKRNNFSVKNIDVNSYVTDGNLNQQLFEQEVLRAFYAEKRSALNQGMSEAQANAYLQLQFNQYIDNEHTWNAMHPDMHAEFKKKMETEFDISNNNYAMYQDTATAKAFASGDINQVKALNDVHALNAFRMARGVETNLVPKDGQVYYQALADVMNHLESADKNVNTKGRHAQYVSHTNSENSSFQQFKEKLSREDLASIDQYVMTVLDAGQRRLTDQQQEQYNAAQQAAQTVQQQQAQATTTQNNPQGTNNGTNQQTNQNQSAGQGSPTQNAGQVPSQGGGVGGTNQPTTNNQTQMGANNAGGATANPAQSGGNGTTGQGTNTSPATDPADQNSADLDGNSQGAGQTPNTGDTVNPTTPTNVGGQTTQSGTTGQASQSGQSVGPTGPSTTQTATGSGSIRTPQTERYSNDGSNQALTKADIKKHLLENGADPSVLTVEVIKHIIALRKNNKLVVPTNLFNATSTAVKNDKFDTAVRDVTGGVSQFHAVQYIATLSNEQFNSDVALGMFNYKQPAGRLSELRAAVLSAFSEIEYNAHLEPVRQERERQVQAQREQNAQARAEEQVRQQQAQAEQKAETDRIKAEQKAQREVEKEQQRRENEITKAQNTITDLERVVEQEQDKVSDLESNIADTTTVKELSEQFLDTALGKKGSRGKKGNIGRKGELLKQIKDTENLLSKANAEIIRLETEKKSLKQRTSEYKEKAQEIKREKNGKVAAENELKSLKSQLKSLEADIKSHEDTVDKATKSLRKLNTELNKVRRALANAQTKLDNANIELDLLLGNNPAQSTTETNADNGSQDVDETDVADIADENPQVAVEQPVQTANDVETIEQAEALVDEVVDAIWYAYDGLDYIDVLSSIYEHYDELNKYFTNLPNAAERLQQVFTELAETQEQGGAIEALGRYWQEQSTQQVSETNEQDPNPTATSTLSNDRQEKSRTYQTGNAEQTATSQDEELDEIDKIAKSFDEYDRFRADLDRRMRENGFSIPDRSIKPTDVEEWVNDVFALSSEYADLDQAVQWYVLDNLEQFIDETDPDVPVVDDIERISDLYLNITDAFSTQETFAKIDSIFDNSNQDDTQSIATYDDRLMGLYDIVADMYPEQAEVLFDWLSENSDNLFLNHKFNDSAILGELSNVAVELEQGQLYLDYQDAWAIARDVANPEQRQALDTLISVMGSQGIPMSERIRSLTEFAQQVQSADRDTNQRIDELVANYPFTHGTLPIRTFIDEMLVAPKQGRTDRDINDPKHRRKYDKKKEKSLTSKQSTRLGGFMTNGLPIKITDRNGVSHVGAILSYTSGAVVFRPDDGSVADITIQVKLADRKKLNRNTTLQQLNKGQNKYTFSPSSYAYTQRDFIRGVTNEPTRQTPQANAKSVKLASTKRAGKTKTADRNPQNQKPAKTFNATLKTLLADIRQVNLRTATQEQTNATQNDLGQSVQPTQERTQDDNEVVRERTSNEPTNDGQGEILGQSGQPISEQSQESGTETTQDTEQLAVDTPTQFDGTPQLLTGNIDDKVVGKTFTNSKGLNKTTILSLIDGKPSPSKLADLLTSEQSNLTQEQAQALVQFARAVRSGEFNQNYADYLTANSNSSNTQTTQKAKTGRELIQDYLNTNPREHAAVRSYFNEQQALAQRAVDENADNLTDEIVSNYNLFNGSEIDFIEKMLGDLPFTDENIAQVIADTRTVYTAGITFDSLPTPVQNIIRKIWDKIKSTVAAISMALAITTGSTFAIPTEANAATPTETAVVQNIVSQNDNQGKQFIVADKQAGTLTLYTPQGQEITSTPALFGKATGDSISINNATPSGRYDMNLIDGARIDGKGYGSSAQALSVNGRLQENNAGNVAIHRVLPIENRQVKLDSATATDNRISHGCINVPSSFYDIHLDRQQDTVVYVMPETNAGKTGVFATQVEQTPQSETTTPAVDKTTPVANVAKEMDNANGQSVEVSAEQITNATPHSEIKQSPVVASAPAKIAGTTPSGQIANVTPTVVGGVTITQIDVPFKVATPAEMQANGVFDTDPISGKERTDDGLSAYDVVLGILGTYGAGAIAVGVGKRRKKLASKQSQNSQQTNVSSQSPTQQSAQQTVNANHNQQAQANKQANGTNHVPTNVQAPPQKTALADAISREMWVSYMNTQSHNNRFTKNGQVTFLDDLTENLDLLGYTYDVVMSDPTYEQINNGTLDGGRPWKFTDPTNRKRTGISASMMNFMAGVTQNFDNLMHKYGIARGGHEADSSLPSIHLAQVRSKASGAYAQIHKLFVKPLFRKIDNLAVELKVGIVGLEADIGRVSTLRHILNEGADALWRSKENLIAERQAQLAAVQAELARTPSGQQYNKTLTDKADMLTKEITQLQDALDNARDMYEGRKAWDGKTKLPGGYTKARAEQDLADIKAKYGSDFSKVENLAKETAQTVLHIRQFATASGVFTNADLDAFNEIGFQEYVPLYKEQKDNRIPDETDNETQTSFMDRLTADIPTQQAKAMGLTKDLSRYAREGSTEIAADGITNLKLFSMNMAGRIGQQQWLQSVQQLYEGNVGKPFSQIAGMSEQELADLNASADSGKLPGLVRVRPGMEEFLPSDLRAAVKDGNVKPIVAKGFNKDGNLVTYHYYFTEPTIQNEVYNTTDLTDTFDNKFFRNVGTITRTAARMMTTFKPVWSAYNYVRDSFERISIMLMRPVKDRNGNLVNRWDLSKAYFKNLAAISSSLPAQQEIYRYLTLGEVKTKLQRDLHEAVGSGAINLMTSQTEKHSVMADIKKSGAEKLTNEAMKMLGVGMNKVGAGKAKQLMEQGLDMYVMRLTEVPQITTALASYLAYRDVGVNQTETANRVRDQYDPLRAGSKYVTGASILFPFVRSTFSGHYNLQRSLTEYWGAGEWQFTALYAIGATLGAIGLFAAMSGLMGDDEDGVPKMARLPTSTLMAGIPVPTGDDSVWSMPVGFGMNKLFLGIGANIYKQWNGWQDGSDTAKNMLGLVMDNTSPVQMSSSKAFDENPVAAVGLSFVPTVLKPIVELGFNVNSFRGGKIINRDTPRDQYDHLQDNFNVPEDYKNMVTWLHKMSGGAVDMRPETLKYLLDGYGGMTGPFSAIPKAILQDKGEKTMGNAMTKGEYFNPLLVAIGADMAIQPNALNITSHTYAMQDLRYELHKQYGVGETHSKEDYAHTADTGPRGGTHNLKAWELTKLKLEEQNAPQEVIDYIVNGMKYNTARKEADGAFKDLADEYYKAKVNGTDTAEMRIALQDAWDNLENLTNEYVMENNRAYYELRK